MFPGKITFTLYTLASSFTWLYSNPYVGNYYQAQGAKPWNAKGAQRSGWERPPGLGAKPWNAEGALYSSGGNGHLCLEYGCLVIYPSPVALSIAHSVFWALERTIKCYLPFICHILSQILFAGLSKRYLPFMYRVLLQIWPAGLSKKDLGTI